MALCDELAKAFGQGERILGLGVNHEGGEVDNRGGGFAVDFVEGDVEDGAAGLAQVVVSGVGGDAYDFVEGLIGSALKRPADRVLAGEEGFGESIVDDGGSGRKSRPETSGIFIVESQPGEMGRNQPGTGLGGAPLIEMSLFIWMCPRR